MALPPSALDRVLVDLAEDLPRISDALKNLLAHEVAAAHVEQRQPFGAAGPAQSLAAVRAVLQAINSAKLPTPHDYGVLFPQPDSQSGLDRMDEITRYKVAYSLSRSLPPTQLPSKMLGRKYLRTIWPLIRPGIWGNDASELTDENLVRRKVVEAIDASLKADSVEPTDLIWNSNLGTALEHRHAKRKQDAAQRAARDEEHVRDSVRDALMMPQLENGGVEEL